MKRFVADEIAGPLEADFQIGALPGDHGRIAELIPGPPFDLLPEDSPTRKTFLGPAPDAGAGRNADMGAINGRGNARSLARMLSPISLGGKMNGVQL